MGHPTVYPTGVTLYHPEKSWSGYTLFQAAGLGALLIDPRGNEVKLWRNLQGFPNKLLPGGQVFGSTGTRDPRVAFQDQRDLVQVDWQGNIRWRFDRLEQHADNGEAARWYARQHHDFQREGNPVGYFAPEMEPLAERGKTLLLVHEDVVNEKITSHPLLDDRIIEVDWDGNILWSWRAHEHVDELGFDPVARSILRNNPNRLPIGDGSGDWLHINSASYLGPNRWYEQGDERFHPDNIIWDSREANIVAIVERRSGKIVWRLGPRYDNNEAERQLGWIIGLHHAHLIPANLPGAGNLLIFDNGGWAGYGESSPASPTGIRSARRDYSRVLEINPATLNIEWQYTPREAGFLVPLDASRFYSPFISSAQRLPNGNTLITEGSNGRIFEVTVDHEIVWEYVSPYRGKPPLSLNMVYRAYRYPYDWVPQLPRPDETAILPPDLGRFRVPGAPEPTRLHETLVESDSTRFELDKDFCVFPDPPADDEGK